MKDYILYDSVYMSFLEKMTIKIRSKSLVD